MGTGESQPSGLLGESQPRDPASPQVPPAASVSEASSLGRGPHRERREGPRSVRQARGREGGASPAPRGFPASGFPRLGFPRAFAWATCPQDRAPVLPASESHWPLSQLPQASDPISGACRLRLFFFFDFLTGVALGAAWWIRCCHVKDPRVLPILVAGAGQTDWAPDGSRRLSRAVPVWLGGPSGCWGPGPVPGVRRSLRHGVLYSLRLPGWQWLVPPRPLPKPGVLLRHSQMPGPGPWRGVTCGDLSGPGRPPQPPDRARPLVQARFPNVTKGKF